MIALAYQPPESQPHQFEKVHLSKRNAPSLCISQRELGDGYHIPSLEEKQKLCKIYDEPTKVPQLKHQNFDAGLITVIDIDETLVDGRDGNCIHLRPNARYFLRALYELGSVIILWSAGVYEHVERCIYMLDPEGTYIYVAVCRGNEWITEKPLTKKLSLLNHIGINVPDRIILIDNSPWASRYNNGKTLTIPDYEAYYIDDLYDTTLGKAYCLLKECHCNLMNQISVVVSLDNWEHKLVSTTNTQYGTLWGYRLKQSSPDYDFVNKITLGGNKNTFNNDNCEFSGYMMLPNDSFDSLDMLDDDDASEIDQSSLDTI